jgi:uncharacterized membrane protein YbhN (UPF0104 family)
MSKITENIGKIDRKALASAVGLMCLSWAALPIVYWLIVKRKVSGKKDGKNS